MKGYKGNIEKLTLDNDNFRKVLYTGQNLQLILMSLEVGQDIGIETHMNNDQFFRFEGGVGKCVIDNNDYHVAEGDAIVVSAGAQHNVINTQAPLHLKCTPSMGRLITRITFCVKQKKMQKEKTKCLMEGQPSKQ